MIDFDASLRRSTVRIWLKPQYRHFIYVSFIVMQTSKTYYKDDTIKSKTCIKGLKMSLRKYKKLYSWWNNNNFDMNQYFFELTSLFSAFMKFMHIAYLQSLRKTKFNTLLTSGGIKLSRNLPSTKFYPRVKTFNVNLVKAIWGFQRFFSKVSSKSTLVPLSNIPTGCPMLSASLLQLHVNIQVTS